VNNLIIKNGTIIDPSANRCAVGDLFVANGKISDKQPENAQVIDATGMWVVPGLIDLHVHFRDPGLTHKEDIETGLRAAAAGGFTTVCTMANTNPATDCPDIIRYQIEKAESLNLGKLLPVSAITKGLNGAELVDIGANLRAGAVAFSDDGKTVANADLMSEFFVRAARADVVTMCHCEDHAADPNMNESEWKIIQRDINLAVAKNARVHICHVSTAEGVEIIKRAREVYKHLVTAEVAPHHFVFTCADVKGSTNAKMAPPLRSEADRMAVIGALLDGTICAIATDHAPHTNQEKSVEFAKAPNGIIGLQTAVALSITELHNKHGMKPLDLIMSLTTNPARVLGIDAGTLQIGKHADVTIIDPNQTWVVDSKVFESKSKNQPYDGMKLTGRVTHTICEGRVIFELTKKK
jgi:dihydroorotase